MNINLQKSEFFPQKLKYFGHTITEGKLMPDFDRVEALTRLCPPRTVSDVRSSLGMLGYFQSSIPNYSCLAAPITDLLKNQVNKKASNKKVLIQWNDIYQ